MNHIASRHQRNHCYYGEWVKKVKIKIKTLTSTYSNSSCWFGQRTWFCYAMEKLISKVMCSKILSELKLEASSQAPPGSELWGGSPYFPLWLTNVHFRNREWWVYWTSRFKHFLKCVFVTYLSFNSGVPLQRPWKCILHLSIIPQNLQLCKISVSGFLPNSPVLISNRVQKVFFWHRSALPPHKSNQLNRLELQAMNQTLPFSPIFAPVP